MPHVKFNTPIPRVSKQLPLAPSASPAHVTSTPPHQVLISSPLPFSVDPSRLLPLLSPSHSSSSSSLLEDGEKDKRRRSLLPVFATAAAVAGVLLVVLMAGMYLPPNQPLIVMPHPPTLALLRDGAATTAPLLTRVAEETTSSLHRLKQKVNSDSRPQQRQREEADSGESETYQQQLNAPHQPLPASTVSRNAADSSRELQQPPPAAAFGPFATSSLSTPPLSLLPYYERNLSVSAKFHNSFFNEPYMRDRNVPTSDRSLLASNRALPHSFPAPLPSAASLLSSSVVIGVFCYNVARIEVLLDTWGKWMLPAHLLIFSEPNSDPAAQLRQQSLPSVVIMSNDANKHRNVTDRRASAWKILPAVRMMFERHPSSPWYYLCDDDSFPLIPNLAHFTANFYSAWPVYTPHHAMYVGESVMQQTFYKGYYADEKVEGHANTLHTADQHCNGTSAGR